MFQYVAENVHLTMTETRWIFPKLLHRLKNHQISSTREHDTRTCSTFLVFANYIEHHTRVSINLDRICIPSHFATNRCNPSSGLPKMRTTVTYVTQTHAYLEPKQSIAYIGLPDHNLTVSKASYQRSKFSICTIQVETLTQKPKHTSISCLTESRIPC